MKNRILLFLLLLIITSCNKKENQLIAKKYHTPDNIVVKKEEKNIIKPKVEDIIKSICSCKPISLYGEIFNNKVFYITEEKGGESNETINLKLNIAEKIGSQWSKIKAINIYSEDYIAIGNEDVKYSTKVLINGKLYYYTPLLIGHLGTAFINICLFFIIYKMILIL